MIRVVYWIVSVGIIGICTAFAIDFALDARRWDEEFSARIGLIVFIIIISPFLTRKHQHGKDFMDKWRARKQADKDITRYMIIAMSGFMLGFFIHMRWFT